MKYVFTDGACPNNGDINARAGIGIFFGDKDKRNVSSEIAINSDDKHTINKAKLVAVLIAFRMCEKE